MLQREVHGLHFFILGASSPIWVGRVTRVEYTRSHDYFPFWSDYNYVECGGCEVQFGDYTSASSGLFLHA